MLQLLVVVGKSTLKITTPSQILIHSSTRVTTPKIQFSPPYFIFCELSLVFLHTRQYQSQHSCKNSRQHSIPPYHNLSAKTRKHKHQNQHKNWFQKCQNIGQYTFFCCVKACCCNSGNGDKWHIHQEYWHNFRNFKVHLI